MDELTALLQRGREGDKEAFGEVVRVMYPQIWRFCFHFVGRDAADDATQETFFSAWRSLCTFRGESSARTWLFVIARRSRSRVASAQHRWEDLGAAAPPPMHPASPEATIEIDDLILRLPEDRRAALILTQIIGLTYAEAADVCDCAVGTIRSRVARARMELLDQERGAQSSERGSRHRA